MSELKLKTKSHMLQAVYILLGSSIQPKLVLSGLNWFQCIC